MIIQHNLAALNTQNKLKNVEKNKMSAMEKLSSGYRINRAADDSAGLSISEKMRAQIRGLDRAALNTEEGSSLINVADGGLSEIHSIIQRQRELMVQAANDTNTETDRQAIEEEVSALGFELDRLFGQTEYNTINIFKGHDDVKAGGYTFPASAAYPNGYTVPDPNPASVKSTTITDELGVVKSSTSVKKKYMSTGYYQDATKDPTLLKKETGDITIKQKDKTGPETYDHVNTFPDGGPGDLAVWDGVAPDPLDDGTVVEASYVQKNRYSSTYTESESVVYTDDAKHDTYLGAEKYTETETEIRQHELKVTKSKYPDGFDFDDYTKVADISPDIIESDGRLHIQNQSGEISFPNSVPEVIVIVDGQELPDAHNWGSITTSADGTTTTFVTNAKNVNGDTYQIKVTRTLYVYKSGNNGSSRYAETYTIEDNDTADGSFTDNSSHTFTFKPQLIDDNGLVKFKKVYCNDEDGNRLGSLTVTESRPYGDRQLEYYYFSRITSIPYEETTTTYTRTETYKRDFSDETDTVFTPQYLDIQVGANAYQNIPIRLWDLSTEKLKGKVPINISAFNANDSLTHLDRILNKMSSIRSYYGALSNRFEHTYANDVNESENLQASESKIRDADMADQMVKFAKDNILEQAGQAMLTQANSINQGILELLR